MKIIKITNKNDYIQILNFLEKSTKYIELLQLIDDNESNFIIEKYNQLLITKKNVFNWNDSGAKGVVYKFDIKFSDKEKIFNATRRFHNYSKYYINSMISAIKRGMSIDNDNW